MGTMSYSEGKRRTANDTPNGAAGRSRVTQRPQSSVFYPDCSESGREQLWRQLVDKYQNAAHRLQGFTQTSFSLLRKTEIEGQAANGGGCAPRLRLQGLAPLRAGLVFSAFAKK